MPQPHSIPYPLNYNSAHAEMTQIAIYLDIIGWTGRQLADRLQIGNRGVFRWLNGQNDPPENLMAWLKKLADFHTANPRPDGWGN
jgi:aminopeptidase-like protein